MNKKVKATKKEYEDFDKWLLEKMGELTDEDKEYLQGLKKSMKRGLYGKKADSQRN